MNFFKLFFEKDTFPDKASIGKLGETYSVEFLKKKNYHIVNRNYRSRLGEIDIIAKENQKFIFVEVKTREEHLTFGSPQDAVNSKKQNRIKKIAQVFLNYQKQDDWNECRFDIIEVFVTKKGELKTINHIKDAF